MGIARRFAGSGDRAAIASLVYDALRRKASSAWIMGEASPRAEILGALKQLRGSSEEEIAALFSGEGHAPAPSARPSASGCERAISPPRPRMCKATIPNGWRRRSPRAFCDAVIEEGRALANRAPVDLRVNTLKTDREKARAALAHFGPAPTPLSPIGLRVPIRADGRGPALSAEPAYVKGLVEVQDEGSQLAALLSGAEPGMQALDFCAGAGGKTLALAGMMANHGQIYASDPDGRRLAPIFERLARSGARNVQVRAPRGAKDVLSDLAGRCDLVLIDAPCSGSGAWRRSPDAKWRMRPGALEQRIKDQAEALEDAARFVKPGGRLVYVTCSVLKAENEDRVAAFLGANADFLPLEAAHWARACGLEALAGHSSKLGAGIRLSPLRTATDGFYVAALTRAT